MNPNPRYTRIIGTGSYLPPRRLTNADLVRQLAARGVETSDEWIVERTGIRARHFVDDGVNASDLAVQAARHALEAAGCRAEDLDLIIVATSTPDMVFPSTAAIVQHKLGVHGCPVFDVQAVCSRLRLCADGGRCDDPHRQPPAPRWSSVPRCSRASSTSTTARTCVLFGDGAGAVVLRASDTPGILATDLHADGRYVDILCVPGTVSGGQVLGDPLLKMDGQAVFKLAVGVLEEHRAQRARQGRAQHRAGGLADPAPGQHPHHAGHRAQAEAADGQADRHGRRPRQHLGRVDPAGAGRGGARRAHPSRRHCVMLQGVGGGFTWGSVLLDF